MTKRIRKWGTRTTNTWKKLENRANHGHSRESETSKTKTNLRIAPCARNIIWQVNVMP